MDFGLLLIIRNPRQWHRPDHEVYQSYIDNAVLGEKLGFTRVWTSEHHFFEDGWSPSQLPILAAIAERTEKVRLGTFVLLMPLHNPIRVAEDAATVDILSNGRLDLAVGPGANIEEFEAFGVPFKPRLAQMHEGLEIVKRCFSEEEFSFKGKFYEFNHVRMTTKPVQKPLPLWVAAQGEKSLAEAGARGYHLAYAPSIELQRIYEGALTKAGHNPRDFQRARLQFCHVAETTEKAWDEAEAHVHYHMSLHFRMLTKGDATTVHGVRDTSVPALGELRKTGRGPYGPALVGSPADVIRILEELFKNFPMTEVIPTGGLPGMDPRLGRRSMELFAKEVMPHFKNNGKLAN